MLKMSKSHSKAQPPHPKTKKEEEWQIKLSHHFLNLNNAVQLFNEMGKV